MDTPVQYEDDTVVVYANGLSIKRYYFPTGRPRRVAFHDVQSVATRPAGFATRWRLWGSTNFVNWFGLDMRRTNKTQFVELDLGKRMKPSFTPDDPDQVAGLISTRI